MSLQEFLLKDSSSFYSQVKWTCSHCTKRFTGEAYTNHQLQLSLASKGVFVCIICKLEFPNQDSMMEHNVNNHERMVYKCSYCPETFKNKLIMNGHKKKAHYGLLDFACSICEKKFVEQQGFLKHQTAVHGFSSKHSQCKECNATLSSQRNLFNHYISFHAKDQVEKHNCPVCNKKFILLDYLKVHLRRIHIKMEHARRTKTNPSTSNSGIQFNNIIFEDSKAVITDSESFELSSKTDLSNLNRVESYGTNIKYSKDKQRNPTLFKNKIIKSISSISAPASTQNTEGKLNDSPFHIRGHSLIT